MAEKNSVPEEVNEAVAAAEAEKEAGRLTPEEPLTEEEQSLSPAEVVSLIKGHVKDEDGDLHQSGGNLRKALRLLPLIDPYEAQRLKGMSAGLDIQYRHGKGPMPRHQRDAIISIIKADVLRAIDTVPKYLRQASTQATEKNLNGESITQSMSVEEKSAHVINIAELFNESPEVNMKALEMILEDAKLMDRVLQLTGKNEVGRSLGEKALADLIFALDSGHLIAYDHPIWQVTLPQELIEFFKGKLNEAKTVLAKD